MYEYNVSKKYGDIKMNTLVNLIRNFLFDSSDIIGLAKFGKIKRKPLRTVQNKKDYNLTELLRRTGY